MKNGSLSGFVGVAGLAVGSRIFKNVVIKPDTARVDNTMPEFPARRDEERFEPFRGSADEALSEAERIVNEARREAERIVNEAEGRATAVMNDCRSQSERLRATTLETARREGYDDGYAKGQAEINVLKREQIEADEAAGLERERMIAEVEPQMVGLVMQAVRLVVGEEVLLQPNAVTQIIRAGLAEANTSGGVTVRVCPEDVDNIMQLRKKIADAVDTGAKIAVVKDPALARGDCVIETAFGAVDCSAGQQLDMLEENLRVMLKAGL